MFQKLLLLCLVVTAYSQQGGYGRPDLIDFAEPAAPVAAAATVLPAARGVPPVPAVPGATPTAAVNFAPGTQPAYSSVTYDTRGGYGTRFFTAGNSNTRTGSYGDAYPTDGITGNYLTPAVGSRQTGYNQPVTTPAQGLIAASRSSYATVPPAVGVARGYARPAYIDTFGPRYSSGAYSGYSSAGTPAGAGAISQAFSATAPTDYYRGTGDYDGRYGVDYLDRYGKAYPGAYGGSRYAGAPSVGYAGGYAPARYVPGYIGTTGPEYAQAAVPGYTRTPGSLAAGYREGYANAYDRTAYPVGHSGLYGAGYGGYYGGQYDRGYPAGNAPARYVPGYTESAGTGYARAAIPGYTRTPGSFTGGYGGASANAYDRMAYPVGYSGLYGAGYGGYYGGRYDRGYPAGDGAGVGVGYDGVSAPRYGNDYEAGYAAGYGAGYAGASYRGSYEAGYGPAAIAAKGDRHLGYRGFARRNDPIVAYKSASKSR